jgi:hypothetical protein
MALLRGAVHLNTRFQLDPSELNRSKLSAFLSLLAEQAFLDQPEAELASTASTPACHAPADAAGAGGAGFGIMQRLRPPQD